MIRGVLMLMKRIWHSILACVCVLSLVFVMAHYAGDVALMRLNLWNDTVGTIVTGKQIGRAHV